MTIRADPRQFDMFAELAPAPIAPPPPALLTDLEQEQARGKAMLDSLVEARLADYYSVSMRYHPRTPEQVELTGMWALPSRLFRFPLSLRLADDKRPNRIVIQHPLLLEHPYVQAIAQFTGFAVCDNHGSDGWGDHGQWHHAVDLVSAGCWKDLIETRRFTTREHIVRAVSYGLDYGPYEGKGKGKGHLTIVDARAIMDAVGEAEPEDRSASVFVKTQFSESMFEKKLQRSTHWPVSAGPDASAWARIHGIEAGWLKTGRSGHLSYTDAAVAA